MQINNQNILNKVITPTIAMGIGGYEAVKNYSEADEKSKTNVVIQDLLTLGTITTGLCCSNKAISIAEKNKIFKNIKCNKILKDYVQGVIISLGGVLPGFLIKEILEKKFPVINKKDKNNEMAKYFKNIDTGINELKKAYTYSGISLNNLDFSLDTIDKTTNIISPQKSSFKEKLKNNIQEILIGPIIPTIIATCLITPLGNLLKEKCVKQKVLVILSGIAIGIIAEKIIDKIEEKFIPSKETQEKILQEIAKRQKELLKLDLFNNSMPAFTQFKINDLLNSLNIYAYKNTQVK